MKQITAFILCGILTLSFMSCAKQTKAMEDIKPAALKSAAFDDYESKNQIREENPMDEAFVAAIQEFSSKVASQTLTGQHKNMCVSPISLYLALSLVTHGAGSDTRSELLNALCLSDELAAKLPKQVGSLMRRLHTDNEIGVLKLANSVWMQNGASFKQKYLDSMSSDFYASLFSVDFSDNATAGKAGNWIKENTGGLLAPAIQFDPNTIMALVNTVYLTDQWIDQFNEGLTAPDNFTKTDNEKVTCDFMNREAFNSAYIKGNGFTAAPLNMKNNGKMIFILPDEGILPDDLLSSPECVADMLDTSLYENGKVVYKIPKFSFGAAPEVKEAVQALGVHKAFETDADFSSIMKDPLWISSILQETHIGIDENGVQAAAYTMIFMASGAFIPEEQEPIMMVLDRPFLFAVMSDAGVPLFIGIVNDPAAV